MSVVQIAGRLVGDGHPCFIAAEIGINHNGDIELAHRCIDAAADAGANAVKFQSFRTEDFIGDRTLTHEYLSQDKTVVESQYDLFKRCELAPQALRELREHCDRRGVIFFSTPSSVQGVEELLDVGAPMLKNGSDFLIHLPLIRAMARTGLPTVLSTGMSTAGEIDEAVRAYREAGGKLLLLLHCTSTYPTAPEDVHLRKIPVLAAAFDCPVGLSDHTQGSVAAIGAVVLGACFIEKHFTLHHDLPGPDHWFSATPAEFGALVDAVRTVEKNLGRACIGPTPSEEQGRRGGRLSCVAARDLTAGHRIVEEDIAFQRPGYGFPPNQYQVVLARVLATSVSAGHVFTSMDFA